MVRGSHRHGEGDVPVGRDLLDDETSTPAADLTHLQHVGQDGFDSDLVASEGMGTGHVIDRVRVVQRDDRIKDVLLNAGARKTAAPVLTRCVLRSATACPPTSKSSR